MAMEPVAAGILLVLAGISFLALAGRAIDAPGLQYDEVLFVNAATGEPTNGLFVAKRVLGVPVMLMGYIGALKAYLYYPIFQLFGVSPGTVRWPVIGLSLVTLAVGYAVARFSFGRLASALLTLVVATDPAFIYMSTLDYGPVVLMLLLKLLALWFALRLVVRGATRDLWGVCLACALGLFDKLNFIWFVVALGLVAGLLFRTELARAYRRNPTGFALPLIGLTVVVVGATLRLVLPQLVASQAEAGYTLLDRVPYMFRLYARTMNGRELYRFVTGSELAAVSLANVVTGLGLAAMLVGGALGVRRAGGLHRLRLGQRIVVFHCLVFLVIGLEIWVTKKAWGPHHMMMLYPLQYLIVFAVAVGLAGTRGAVLLAVVLVASGASVARAYDRAFRADAEFEPQWSPMMYDLVRYLEHRGADRIISVDWGIHNQLFALGTAATRTAVRDRWPQFQTLGDSAAQLRLFEEDVADFRTPVALLHGQGWDNMSSVRPNFFAWAAAVGITPVLERRFTSRSGIPVFEVYSLRRGQPPSGSSP